MLKSPSKNLDSPRSASTALPSVSTSTFACEQVIPRLVTTRARLFPNHQSKKILIQDQPLTKFEMRRSIKPSEAPALCRSSLLAHTVTQAVAHTVTQVVAPHPSHRCTQSYTQLQHTPQETQCQRMGFYLALFLHSTIPVPLIFHHTAPFRALPELCYAQLLLACLSASIWVRPDAHLQSQPWN